MLTQGVILKLSYEIIGAAIEVHKHLGPGLLEAVYHKCLTHELELRGMAVQSQVLVPVQYKGLELTTDYRLDILVNNLIIVELKAVETLLPVHQAQLLTYMKLLQKPKGLLINFNVESISKHIVSLVTDIYRNLPE